MSANNPLVSVVILCRDDALLRGTLDSLLAQTFPSIEIVVVGDSPEGDGQQLPATVRFFGGVVESEGWNFGASQALGKYFCFIRAGEELLPTYVEKCLFLAESGGFGLCASREQGEKPANIGKPGPFRPDPLRSDNLAPLIGKATFQAIAGYDTRLSPEEQPSDLWIRLGKAGVRMSILPEMLVKTGSPFGLSRSPRAELGGGENGRRGHQPSILLAMPYLTVGGAEAVVSQLCRQLYASGFRLFIILTMPVREGQGDTSPWFEDLAAGIYHLPRFLDVSLWPAFICYLIQQHSIDAIWQVGSESIYYLLPQIRQLFPQIAVVDQLFNPVGHTANYLKYRHLIDHVVTEHTGMKDWLMQHGETEDRISVIPNGVNLEWYSPQPKIDWRTRRPRPPDDGRLVVGFIGRLSVEKGPDLFLDIAAQLGDRPDIEFVICGGGPMERGLRAETATKGLCSRVHFLGFVDQRAGHTPCCDVVVVCSRLDGRPNVVMEALASGMPVIASRVGGIPDMMPDGSGGQLCEPGDVNGFEQAIRTLAEDRNLYRRRSVEARSHAEKHFSFADAGKRYADIFQKAGKRRGALTPSINGRVAAGSSGLAPFIPKWPAQRSRFLIAFRILCMLLAPSRLTTTWRNALLYRDLNRDSAVADHFDGAFYLRMNPDVSMSGIPPLLHYVFRGFLEGRDPSPQFDSANYLALYPEVERSGVNPLLHYLASGKVEERSFSE